MTEDPKRGEYRRATDLTRRFDEDSLRHFIIVEDSAMTSLVGIVRYNPIMFAFTVKRACSHIRDIDICETSRTLRLLSIYFHVL